MKYTQIIEEFQGEYRWLSNFWIYDDVRGLSVEHHYQAAKAKHYEDYLRIMSAENAYEAKKIGKSIDHGGMLVVRSNWHDIRLTLMEQFTRVKYATNHGLKQKLLNTQGMLLIEGNKWGDTFWGVCNGVGENNLGKIIMKVRDEFLA